jgi:hypothetical protein
MATRVTPRPLSYTRLVVFALPLLFVVVSWFASAGFPYYLDNNESFLMYVEARNLEIWDPWQYAWVSAEATDPTRTTSDHFYTHQPNASRYLHYLLLRAGISDLAPQVLILSLVATGLTVVLLWKLFGSEALLAVPLAVVLDFAGYLVWTLNTYRSWMFVLFFGMVLAVRKNRPVWFAILAFLVVQLDFGIAAFVCAAMGIFAIFTHGGQARRFALAGAIGVALSLVLFGVQVLAFYGWDGFIHELSITYTRRGTAGDTAGAWRYLYQSWHGPALLLNMVARETHSIPVYVMVLWGLASAGLALRRGNLSETHRFVAQLTISSLLGAVVASTVLYGYFVDAFVVSILPLASFLIAPALGVLAIDLHDRLIWHWNWPHVRTLSTLAVVLPLLATSAMRFEPPFALDLFQRLQTEYRGRTIIAPNVGPWMANDALAFALTGGRAIRASELGASPSDGRHLDDLRDSNGALTYLCLDTVYLRKRPAPDAVNLCDLAEASLVAPRHQMVANGQGWFIMEIGDETLADVPPETAQQ